MSANKSEGGSAKTFASISEERYRQFLDFLPDPVFVFNLDNTVSYLNPAFEHVFGWTLAEVKGRRIPLFVPDHMKEKTREGISRLFREKVLHNFVTQRYTKDGRLRDIIIDGAIFYDQDQRPAGQVITLRDVTREKRTERINQALFRVAQALHRYRRLADLLEFITREIQSLMSVDGASVILLDENKKEFYFPVAAYEDSDTGSKIREIRFPVDKGVAGHVYRTGEPLIVPDTSKSPYFYRHVDEQSKYSTRNMLDVPLRIKDRMIGVLCAVNKKAGTFDDEDVDLLMSVGNMVALPLENARIHHALKKSYENVKNLNRAKDRVIHHLSHELKTPLSVLSASLSILEKRISTPEDKSIQKLFDRARRNLNRLLEMQYGIEDILRGKEYASHLMLSKLLDACSDELETLVSAGAGEPELIRSVKDKIDVLFGPHAAKTETLHLDQAVGAILQDLRPAFSHRSIQLTTRFFSTIPVSVPREVLAKIVETLIRNSVENTPDGGKIEVIVRNTDHGPELEVKDFGVGITDGKQSLIIDNYFAADDPMSYSSKKPFDFNAGGKGFDLLRITIFSERYGFKTKLISKRCTFIPGEDDLCPGKIEWCEFCKTNSDCYQSGYTTMIIRFNPTS
ncbi:MAG: PAS domain S-box protein [Desulfobacteraceae bacterium]|nr:PAS domain S-box protein [Desulfobacteraceae bacterium]